MLGSPRRSRRLIRFALYLALHLLLFQTAGCKATDIDQANCLTAKFSSTQLGSAVNTSAMSAGGLLVYQIQVQSEGKASVETVTCNAAVHRDAKNTALQMVLSRHCFRLDAEKERFLPESFRYVHFISDDRSIQRLQAALPAPTPVTLWDSRQTEILKRATRIAPKDVLSRRVWLRNLLVTFGLSGRGSDSCDAESFVRNKHSVRNKQEQKDNSRELSCFGVDDLMLLTWPKLALPSNVESAIAKSLQDIPTTQRLNYLRSFDTLAELEQLNRKADLYGVLYTLTDQVEQIEDVEQTLPQQNASRARSTQARLKLDDPNLGAPFATLNQNNLSQVTQLFQELGDWSPLPENTSSALSTTKIIKNLSTLDTSDRNQLVKKINGLRSEYHQRIKAMIQPLQNRTLYIDVVGYPFRSQPEEAMRYSIALPVRFSTPKQGDTGLLYDPAYPSAILLSLDTRTLKQESGDSGAILHAEGTILSVLSTQQGRDVRRTTARIPPVLKQVTTIEPNLAQASSETIDTGSADEASEESASNPSRISREEYQSSFTVRVEQKSALPSESGESSDCL